MPKPKTEERRKAHILKEDKWVPGPFNDVKKGDILKIEEGDEDKEFIKNQNGGLKFVALKDAYLDPEEDKWVIAVDDET